ncbi:fimbria/pilus periplasmic chaperone [Luteibacter sp. PPL201]|uniref:Fimbria/pilus periplasmic chaperone n=1 Tax=Luteibacter sahnii TaxID=3021977 RepID=A0ABT6BE22_9GAMM
MPASRLRPLVAWTVVALSLFATSASASVVMNATRYIFRAGEREIAVKVSNVGKAPVLSQAWIDDGDANATPENVHVPFNLTPPIARIEAGKAQTLRIAFTQGDLPTDRESLFWLNVLEVPPKPADGEDDSSHIQLALRYRLKLFYRPARLKGSPDDAAKTLVWATHDDHRLTVRNDSAFHVTVNDAALRVGEHTHAIEPFAVAPGATKQITVDEFALSGETINVTYQTINDYGGFVEHATKL